MLELIITITIAAILAAMLVSFFGTTITSSVFPVLRVKEQYTLNQVFENINSDYRKLILEDATPLLTLQSRVSSGYYGTYTVVQNNFITFSSDAEQSNSGNRILKVTLSKGDHKLISLFTK